MVHKIRMKQINLYGKIPVKNFDNLNKKQQILNKNRTKSLQSPVNCMLRTPSLPLPQSFHRLHPPFYVIPSFPNSVGGEIRRITDFQFYFSALSLRRPSIFDRTIINALITPRQIKWIFVCLSVRSTLCVLSIACRDFY